MRRKWRKAKPKEISIKFVSNRDIKFPEVFLIDEEGTQVGRTSIEDAIARAEEYNLDLVLVNPKAEPPVAKIVDLGQLKYEADKKAHKQKVLQKKVDTKEIRLSVRISEHDFNFRLEQARKFLAKDSKIKIDLRLKGREKQHLDKALETINKFIIAVKSTENMEVIDDQPLTKQGGRFIIVLMNKK